MDNKTYLSKICKKLGLYVGRRFLFASENEVMIYKITKKIFVKSKKGDHYVFRLIREKSRKIGSKNHKYELFARYNQFHTDYCIYCGCLYRLIDSPSTGDGSFRTVYVYPEKRTKFTEGAELTKDNHDKKSKKMEKI